MYGGDKLRVLTLEVNRVDHTCCMHACMHATCLRGTCVHGTSSPPRNLQECISCTGGPNLWGYYSI